MSGVTEKQPALHVWQALIAANWAMLPERLLAIFEIAARENLDIEAVAAQLGRPLDNSRAVTVRDGVAIIPIEGVIFPRATLFSAISGGATTDAIAQDLAVALADATITGIVLAVDSPGGDVNGIAEVAQMIYAARAQKPIVAYVRDLGASAAYWLAAAASEVVVASTALVGSIGIIGTVADPKKVSSRSIEFVSSRAPHKRPDPTTQAGSARIQARIDEIEAIFHADVARFRGVTPETVASDFGQGDVMVGQAAVDAGMADRVGSFEGVVAELQQRAREPRRFTSAGRIAAQDTGGTVAQQQKPSWMDGFRAFIRGDDSAFMEANIAASGAPIAGVVGTPAHPDAIGMPGATQAASGGENEELTRLRAELDRLRADDQARAESDIATRATAFAEAEIVASRALPANRDTLIAAYTDAATDDLAHPRAEGQPSRVARLEALQASHVPHALTGEAVPVKAGDEGTLHLLASAATTRAEGAPAPATVEGWREQRAFTATGRTILTALGIPATGPLSDAHRATIAARMREQGLTIAE